MPTTTDSLPVGPVAFDPDAYLASGAKGFDPDAYLQAEQPQGSAVVDVTKRVARGALSGSGDVARAVAEASGWDGIPEHARSAADKLREQGMSEDDVTRRFESPWRSLARGLDWLAAKINTDQSRDHELKSVIAEGAGAAVPALTAGVINPVAGVVTLAGQMGEAERRMALAAGDSPELAAEKAKVARLGGAVMGALPVGPVRKLAGVSERLATRAATGAVINASQDAALQKALEGEVDWGRVKLAGAFGAGLGLVLGVPEALALRKALGTAGSHEGKTLATAIDDIATETGMPPTELQRRINEMVGIKSAEVAPAEPSMVQRQIDMATGVGAEPAGAANSLFADRLRRQADAEAAFGAESEASMNQRAFDLTRARAEELQMELNSRQLAGSETIALGNDPVRNQLSAIQTRRGNSARERARLEAQTPSDIVSTGNRLPQLSAQAQRLYDEHGGVNPEALLPVARSAIGGALGYASGDTPEERVRNAMLGMGFGAVASPALVKRLTKMVVDAPASKKVADVARQRLVELRLRVAPQSILPEDVRTQLRWGEQAARSVTQTGLSLVRDLEANIRGVGDKAMQAATASRVQDFLTGGLPATALPAPVRITAQKVRNYVDDLSDRAVAEGVVSGSMAQTFLNNRGSYLRRSYEIFLDPDYKPTQRKIDAAIGAIEQSNRISRSEAEAIVAGILDKNGRANTGDFLLGRGKIAGKDVSSLVRRHDLLPEVRDLLGEISDPVLSANQTIPRLARLIELDATQRTVRDIGLRTGLFSEARSLDHPTPLVAENSRPHDVLAGLYAAPEIAGALQREAGTGRTAFVPELLWRTLTSATTVAKLSKTVGNPESYGPNLIGGIIANIGNANFRYSHSGRGLALGAEELGALRRFLPTTPSRDALRSELQQLHKLGLIGESLNSGDLLRTIEQSFFGKLRDSTASVLTVPAKVYGGIDDFNRYIAWQSERARYAKAFPTWSSEQLSRHAADVVRATVPTYSEVPKLVKQLSVAGLTPSFVNFTWEVFRNTKNSFKIGLRDLREGRVTGNPALTRAGAERLAAITAVLSAGSMFGLSKISHDEHGITDAKDKAVRDLSPPWNRDGMLLYLSRAERGEPVQVANISYLVPHALLWQAIEAGRRGAEDDQAFPEFVRALNEQFGFGNNVLIPAIAGAVQGFEPKTGRPIPATAVSPTMGDRAKYLAEEAFTPLAVTQAEKWKKAFTGEVGDYGRVYSVREQMQRLLGMRAQTFDPLKAVQWKARDLAENLRRASDIYRLRLKHQLPPERLSAVYSDANEARRSQFKELSQLISHARVLGVDDEKVIAAMRAAHIPAKDILDAFDGRYTPLSKESRKSPGELLAEIQARPISQRQAALAEIYRQDPALAEAVVNRAKREAKGRSEADKLILTLGVADGERASYLRGKLSELPDVASRRAWLLDLRRKGILTDTVFNQMAADAR